MDPAFWNNLPSIIAAAVGGIVTILGFLLRRDIKENTRVTVDAKDTVVNKVDSAQKEVSNTVVASAQEVKKEAVQTAQAAATIARSSLASAKEANKEVISQLAPIAEKLNGGPGGLADITQRLAALEGRHNELVQGHAELVKGHIEITKSIDRLSALIERE